MYALFVLWPAAWTGWLALQKWNGYGPQSFIGLANVQSLLADPLFRTSLAHSAFWIIAAAVLPTALGFGLATLAIHSPLSTLAISVFFFPILLPATVVASIWTLVYSPLSGLLNTVLLSAGLGGLTGDWLGDPHLALPALFLAWLWSTVGISVIIAWISLRSTGREYLDLAVTEGANAWQRLRRVDLPGARRGLALAALINVALGLQVFDLVFVTTGGGPGYSTMLLSVDLYGRAFGGHPGQAAAEAAISVLMAIILAAVAIAPIRSWESLSGHEHHVRRPAQPATAVLALCLIVFLLPLAWLGRAVAEPGRAFALGSSALSPEAAGQNVATAWNAGGPAAAGTSLALAAGVTVLALLLAVPAGFALSRAPAPVRATAMFVLLIGLFQPNAAAIIPLFNMLKAFGLLGTIWGALLPEAARAIPFVALLLWGFLIAGRTEIVEAARVDGASSWQQMTRIALPLARPALYAAGVWAFVSSWNEYLLPTIVSQDGSLQTVPTLLAGFLGAYDTQFGALAAGSLLAITVPLILYLIVLSVIAAGSKGEIRANGGAR